MKKIYSRALVELASIMKILRCLQTNLQNVSISEMCIEISKKITRNIFIEFRKLKCYSVKKGLRHTYG